MSKTKTLILCPTDAYFLPIFDSLRDRAELAIGNDAAFLSANIADTEVFVNSGLTGRAPHLRNVWKDARKLRWIHSLAAGVENLLFPELVESPIPVTNAKGVFKRSLAEFVIFAILSFYKRGRRLIHSQAKREWDQFMVESMARRTMGVVGYGEIGRECALLARGMGMRIVATRRRTELSGPQDPTVDRYYPLAELQTMLPECDVVVLATPATPDTFHMMGEQQFKAMKNSALFINVGRGSAVDEPALVRALTTGEIAGAALDVFEKEPLPKDSPLWDFENVLISPHCTDRTVKPDWMELAAQRFVENFERFAKGEPLEYLVDKKAGY